MLRCDALLTGFCVAAAFAAAAAAPVEPDEQIPAPVADCLVCHEGSGSTLAFDDGSELSLDVDAGAYMGSVHGGAVVCTDCHAGYDDDHPFGVEHASARDYVRASYEACRSCHFDAYTRTLEGVHYELSAAGLDMAPVCTDCHGAHDVSDPRAKPQMIDRSCAACHDGVYREYAGSVHGRALGQGPVSDVPGCADCHEHHSIEPPHTARFKIRSPRTCIGCHGDERKMAPYGLSTAVATTFLTDFHGVTAAFADPDEVDQRRLTATCVDCHGHHGMESPDELGAEAMKETVAAVCASCHEGAAVDFPAAWLSHYEPSLEHAPLVYLADWLYKIMIPFIVVGLALHVVVDLYRVASGR